MNPEIYLKMIQNNLIKGREVTIDHMVYDTYGEYKETINPVCEVIDYSLKISYLPNLVVSTGEASYEVSYTEVTHINGYHPLQYALNNGIDYNGRMIANEPPKRGRRPKDSKVN